MPASLRLAIFLLLTLTLFCPTTHHPTSSLLTLYSCLIHSSQPLYPQLHYSNPPLISLLSPLHSINTSSSLAVPSSEVHSTTGVGQLIPPGNRSPWVGHQQRDRARTLYAIRTHGCGHSLYAFRTL